MRNYLIESGALKVEDAALSPTLAFGIAVQEAAPQNLGLLVSVLDLDSSEPDDERYYSTTALLEKLELADLFQVKGGQNGR